MANKRHTARAIAAGEVDLTGLLIRRANRPKGMTTWYRFGSITAEDGRGLVLRDPAGEVIGDGPAHVTFEVKPDPAAPDAAAPPAADAAAIAAAETVAWAIAPLNDQGRVSALRLIEQGSDPDAAVGYTQIELWIGRHLKRRGAPVADAAAHAEALAADLREAHDDDTRRRGYTPVSELKRNDVVTITPQGGRQFDVVEVFELDGMVRVYPRDQVDPDDQYPKWIGGRYVRKVPADQVQPYPPEADDDAPGIIDHAAAATPERPLPASLTDMTLPLSTNTARVVGAMLDGLTVELDESTSPSRWVARRADGAVQTIDNSVMDYAAQTGAIRWAGVQGVMELPPVAVNDVVTMDDGPAPSRRQYDVVQLDGEGRDMMVQVVRRNSGPAGPVESWCSRVFVRHVPADQVEPRAVEAEAPRDQLGRDLPQLEVTDERPGGAVTFRVGQVVKAGADPELWRIAEFTTRGGITTAPYALLTSTYDPQLKRGAFVPDLQPVTVLRDLLRAEAPEQYRAWLTPMLQAYGFEPGGGPEGDAFLQHQPTGVAVGVHAKGVRLSYPAPHGGDPDDEIGTAFADIDYGTAYEVIADLAVGLALVRRAERREQIRRKVADELRSIAGGPLNRVPVMVTPAELHAIADRLAPPAAADIPTWRKGDKVVHPKWADMVFEVTEVDRYRDDEGSMRTMVTIVSDGVGVRGRVFPHELQRAAPAQPEQGDLLADSRPVERATVWCTAHTGAHVAGPTCVDPHYTGERHPCAAGCSDPAAHAEGAHDV